MRIKKCLNCNIRLENSTENFCEDCMSDFSYNGVKFGKELEEVTPLIDELSEEIVDSVFEEFWRENKREIKELSKKEVAIQMYSEGLCEALSLAALTGVPKEFYESLISQVRFVNLIERLCK